MVQACRWQLSHMGGGAVGPKPKESQRYASKAHGDEQPRTCSLGMRAAKPVSIGNYPALGKDKPLELTASTMANRWTYICPPPHTPRCSCLAIAPGTAQGGVRFRKCRLRRAIGTELRKQFSQAIRGHQRSEIVPDVDCHYMGFACSTAEHGKLTDSADQQTPALAQH